MRRLASVLTVAALVLTLLAAGCAEKKEETLAAVPEEIAKAIVDGLDFKADLVPISQGAVDNWYFLDESVDKYAIYINADVVPAEEVAVLAGKSAEDLEGLEAILDRRLENLADSFEFYQPEEMPKINNPVRAAKANVAVMVLTDDPDAAKVIEELLK